MADRQSRTQRITARNIAETEIMRHANDHALWHKYVHNVTLDPMQILKCIEMDKHRNTIDFSSRRTGKTAVKEMYCLKELATLPDQELGIVAPREAQSKTNLDYHLEAIRRSPILTAWLNFKSNRVQMADTYYQFANRSKAQAYGIMANVDGGDLTMASLEEVDDMPRDRLYGRFLLMMGSTRRLGADEGSKNNPQIRITGVFKGADTLSEMIAGGQYTTLPTVDAYLGIELGILNAAFIEQMRIELDPDEYIRQLLCRNIASRNLVWLTKVRQAMQYGLRAKLDLVQPFPGETYRKRGLLSFGYDAAGHGENPTSSRHALVVSEQIGNFVFFPFVKQWPAGAPEPEVMRDLIAFWRYFHPDYAIGDAYGVGMLTALNDSLFAEGLTTIDRRSISDGDSVASAWGEWAFAPLRFEGMTKHQMAQALRTLFQNDHAVLPYIDDKDLRDPTTYDLRAFIRQLPNIVSKPTKQSYASYKMADPKRGDDLFDAAMAAVWALVTRGASSTPTVILSTSHSRESLLTKAA